MRPNEQMYGQNIYHFCRSPTSREWGERSVNEKITDFQLERETVFCLLRR